MKEQSQRSQLAWSTTVFSSLSSGGQETEAGRSTHRETASLWVQKEAFPETKQQNLPLGKKKWLFRAGIEEVEEEHTFHTLCTGAILTPTLWHFSS